MNSVYVALETYECWVCSVPFGLSASFAARKRKTGEGFSCPNGCAIAFGEGEVTKLKRQLESAKTRLSSEIERRKREVESEKRRHAATKGKVTKLKKRASAGVCPCCNRTFKQLAAHMKTQHPEFVAESGGAS